MFAYVVRRLLYAIPILIGVNLITFALFFIVNTPDDMARMQLGIKRVTPEAIHKWKAERGYDKPLFYNAQAEGGEKFTRTIFFSKSIRMFVFEFGRADDGRDIANEIGTRMGPSLAIALPTFVLSLFVTIAFALLLVLFRATYFDFWGVVIVRGDDVHFGFVLHHRRAVPGGQTVESGADLGLRGRTGCDPLPRPAGGCRRHRRHRLRHALVSHDLPRGDQSRLCAHCARQGLVGVARAVRSCAEERDDSRSLPAWWWSFRPCFSAA